MLVCSLSRGIGPGATGIVRDRITTPQHHNTTKHFLDLYGRRCYLSAHCIGVIVHKADITSIIDVQYQKNVSAHWYNIVKPDAKWLIDYVINVCNVMD